MAERQTLLLEIGTEELPPKSLCVLSDALGNGLLSRLAGAGLAEKNSELNIFASPRRLAVSIEGVTGRQPDQLIERRGPAVAAAFDKSGAPTRAALGFARSVGREVSELKRQSSPKGEWLFCTLHQSGKHIGELLPGLVESALKDLPIARRMRWGAGEAEFIRPVHWLVLMHGTSVIDANLLSCSSGNRTRGHRFHSAGEIELQSANQYSAVLEQDGMVMVDFMVRRETIASSAKKLGIQCGGEAIIDADLLDEVTGIVEWPFPLQGCIDDQFMNLPREVLVSSMQDHQKYFPVDGADGRLLPVFITISNIRSKDESRVIRGNERVLRARLSDARFFWEQDKAVPLARHCKRLGAVLFHKKLGSLGDKTVRVASLAAGLADILGADPALVDRAARLCKADLVTDMVGEFPELQGVMGQYYALNDGEPATVATAIGEHYQPRFAGDDLPATAIGKAIALADRLDTVCGVFAAGEKPTGDKDPYGLRRSALGLLRILIESGAELDLRAAISESLKLFTGPDLDTSCHEQIYRFVFDRLKQYYQAQGYSTRLYQAVAAVEPCSPVDFDHRLKAVSDFAGLDAALSLIEANKRIGNILHKSGLDSGQVDRSALVEAEEIGLYESVQAVSEQTVPMLEIRDYKGVLTALANLKQPVDDFFDHVMVMDEDAGKRNNRIALLRQINRLFGHVADISCLK